MPLSADDITGLVAVVMALAIPIIAIMVAHQQKMARLFREQNTGLSEQAAMQLINEVRELRAMATHQALLIDNLQESQRKLATSLEARAESRVVGS